MNPTATQSASAPFHLDQFLVEVADIVNTTLDLDALLQRTAEMVRRVIDYEIFAILLLNDKTQELRIRFQIGHPPEVADRLRVKVGEGVTGRAAKSREAVLVNDVASDSSYIKGVEGVRSELAVPLIVKNKVIGVIDIEASQAGYFTEEHRRLLTLVASRIAAGVENARLYTRVSRQAQTLALLNEISRDLTSILNVDELLQSIAETLTRLIDYQMFSILLLDDSGKKLVHRFSMRFKENIHLKHDISVGRGLVGAAAQLKQAVLVPDVSKDPRYIMANPETKSELCVPLIHKGGVIGVLDLEHTRRNYFTEDHKRTMTTLAAQLAIAIENARLYEKIAKQEERLEREMAMAHEIQLRLLPQVLPTLCGARVAARFMPARTIGGDIYEFLLSEIAESGKNGQFRTPRHIIRMMVQMIAPRPTERICDPAAGTCGFLVNAYQYALETHTPPASLTRRPRSPTLRPHPDPSSSRWEAPSRRGRASSPRSVLRPR